MASHEKMSQPSLMNWRLSLCGLTLLAAAVAAFRPILENDFLLYDDPQYVTRNPHVTSGLSVVNIKWAFTTTFASNWHPLTWISHMVDVNLFGLRPGGHHLTSLAFHLANTVLLLLFLYRLSGSVFKSTAVAALFALHPLHVESVAWAAERKDVLSAFFFFCALYAYLKYFQSPGVLLDPKKRGKWVGAKSLWYVASLFMLALGLMSKPMLVTTPLVLLLIDWWAVSEAKRRGSLRSFIIEKFPFAILSLISCIVTVVAQQKAMASGEDSPFLLRLSNAALAYVWYLAQTFWPNNLSIFYPLSPTPTYVVLSCIVVLLVIAWLAFRLRGHFPYLTIGWFWFVAMLIPVIGIVQVGQQAHADRYTYLPLIGIFIALVWGFDAVVRRFTSRPVWVSCLALFTVATCLLFRTFLQTTYWKNNQTIFQHALHSSPRNYMAFVGLAIDDLQHQNTEAALLKLKSALGYTRTKSTAGVVNYYIAVALHMEGKPAEAFPFLQSAVVAPELQTEGNYLRGLSLMALGRYEQSESSLRSCLEAEPENKKYEFALVQVLIARSNNTEAEDHLRSMALREPKDSQVTLLLAEFLARQNRLNESEQEFEKAVELGGLSGEQQLGYARLLAKYGHTVESTKILNLIHKQQPNSLEVTFALAEALSDMGRDGEAVPLYETVLAVQPSLVPALNNLGWILATSPDPKTRNGKKAVEVARSACELTHFQEPRLLGTLAAAYAESGQFSDAVQTTERAIAEAKERNLNDVVEKNEPLLDLYRARKPFRSP